MAYKDTTMSNERFNDEVLSAIIDGEADAETIASVSADVEASARLEHLRSAVEFVAAPIPEATPERRSASIAAAMAVAESAPEVSSLAAARHERAQTSKRWTISPTWLAIAAAMLLFVVAIPLLVRFSPDADQTVATDSSDDVSLNVAESAEESDGAEPSFTVDSDEESDGGDSGSAEADAPADDEAMEDRSVAATTTAAPAETQAPADIAGEENPDDRLGNENFVTVNNIDSLDSLLNIGSVQPTFSADDAIIAGVNPDCVQPNTSVTAETPYALINLTPFAGEDRLILVEFADDGTTRILEAEDCAPLG
ncbi:MAG: hypothetical protein ACI81L_000825 [Verrucomicrobiales bacterium]